MLKSLILVFCVLFTQICFSQNTEGLIKSNKVDEFSKRFNIDADISQIGSTNILVNGTYQTNGNYLSFITEQKIQLYGLRTDFIWYFFTTNGKLSKIGLVFNASELGAKLSEFGTEFYGTQLKDKISNKSYWKGTKYNVYIQMIDETHRAVFISNPKIWPIWKE